MRVFDEESRIEALERLDILDTPPEPQFDKITRLIKTILGVPIAAVTLIHRERQWVKSIVGLDDGNMPRRISFCNQTIQSAAPLRIEDTAVHPAFLDNPLVVNPPNIRAYIGAPLITQEGYAIGSVCALDYSPRAFSEDQAQLLAGFAELVVTQIELRRVATVDLLTGIATRRAFMDAVDEAIADAGRTGGAASLVCLDLDRFKSINDTHGHAAGDAVLAAVGQIIQQSAQEENHAGRIGGEELALLLPGRDLTAAADIARRLCREIQEALLESHPGIRVTASLGVAALQPGMSAKDWLAAADSALYRAKEGGRNCVICCGQLDDDTAGASRMI